MAFLSEAAVEQALLDQLRAIDYSIEREEDIGPDGHRPERESHDEVVLKKRFEDAVARLNPALPLEARQDAVRRVMQSELPSLLEENRRLHKLMTEGVDVEYYANDGTLTAGKVALIDFENPEQNDWLAVSQFVVINGQNNRRPDVVVFVNGLPLGVIELKAPGSAGAHLLGAFNQLQTYKQQIPALFHTNALLVTSDGIAARVGSLSADLERFMLPFHGFRRNRFRAGQDHRGLPPVPRRQACRGVHHPRGRGLAGHQAGPGRLRLSKRQEPGPR